VPPLKNIRQGVDGFAFERIDGTGVLFGVLESAMAEENKIRNAITEKSHP